MVRFSCEKALVQQAVAAVSRAEMVELKLPMLFLTLRKLYLQIQDHLHGVREKQEQ